MEKSPAIDKNWEALKRLLAMLVGMAEMAGGGSTLPRHLHRAILKLLRPAESAARRLIIAAARGLVVILPPLRPRKPKPKKPKPTSIFVRDGIGTGIVLRPGAPMPAHLAHLVPRKPAQRAKNLSLLDPLKNPFRIHRRHVPARSVPRISGLDFNAPYRPLPAPPSPDDPVDAARLGQRLEALGRALDDLPGEAQRFARWKARNDAARARDRQARAAGGEQASGAVRFRRVSPLRRGRPPGGRLSRYDPTATHPRNIREIDEILAHAHALAVYALETPDTS
ncbi:hypothetical protein RB623_13785 [Mesorhizobium sp. LHD-90]|uniref:hypothetical protein n=1 Tax=Mesorhizobium sp. LHD-90 TaxID=3071414 RepID=UPI0027E1E10C|nr:hypothetical protein [Mesorhizobium sp. LHD-90]MDQ6435123.1 hypothetical protein [Mesorhizobium sp. LHD-90]